MKTGSTMLDIETLEFYLDIQDEMEQVRQAAEVRILTQLAEFPPATAEVLIARRLPPKVVARLFLDCLSRRRQHEGPLSRRGPQRIARLVSLRGHTQHRGQTAAQIFAAENRKRA
jgi:hypothetical protein